MSTLRLFRRFAAIAACAGCLASGWASAPMSVGQRIALEQSNVPAPTPGAKASSAAKHGLDRSGRKQLGKASFYADRFAGRKMADGTRMDPLDSNAASKTLPLGTTARVTNLQTGRSAVVTIQDRGPYVKGRIVDLSPATAREIGITRRIGVAWVEVEPLQIP
jgi:rare lipoprotein A